MPKKNQEEDRFEKMMYGMRIFRSDIALLIGVAKMSRILIITRSEIVGTRLDTSKLYILKDRKKPRNATIKTAREETVSIYQGVSLVMKDDMSDDVCCNVETKWLSFKGKMLSRIITMVFQQISSIVLLIIAYSYPIMRFLCIN
ncbi:hypothetical protein DVH24_010691 [Malus domestica]|uniref:Uncharacterized protein n=1 Tax=Malus domestica TaxID=3750 RepID=A0A498JTJ7_MALDO|nr:hypothetical protein DVH24_010691 [Malus domestica]